MIKNGWEIVYEQAVREDGSLFFPNRLSHEFLQNAKRSMGSYLFANQYLNIVMPEELKTFKKDWFRRIDKIPENCKITCFIDPAIGQEKHNDFTGVTVVAEDAKFNWYVLLAKKFKITPTDIVNLCFQLYDTYQPHAIGIEEVAYQKAILYFLDEEIKRRKKYIPIVGVKPPSQKSKEMRVLSLVPRYEFGRVYHACDTFDLESELLDFPRGAHDDLIDSLAYHEYLISYPSGAKEKNERPAPASSEYERWYIQNIHKIRESEESY